MPRRGGGSLVARAARGDEAGGAGGGLTHLRPRVGGHPQQVGQHALACRPELPGDRTVSLGTTHSGSLNSDTSAGMPAAAAGPMSPSASAAHFRTPPSVL